MKFIGFNFNKISVERLEPIKSGLKINTNVEIVGVKEAKSDFFNSNEDLLEVKFSYNIKYDPKVAELDFSGLILVSMETKEAKDILKKWKKKDLPKDFQTQVVNIVMHKASLKALALEDDMNLPLHIPMPSIKEDK